MSEICVSSELNAQKIAEIRNRIKKQNSIFKDRRFLDWLYVPSKIMGREEQVEQLVKYLDSVNEGALVPSIAVFGRSGAGKSTIVKFVCRNMSDTLVHSFVNLRTAKTVFGCANLILSELGVPELKSADGMNKVIDSIGKRILEILKTQKKKFFVLALDEYDVLFSYVRGKPSDFVYKLMNLVENLREKGVWLCIITISNNSLADYDLDDRVKSRMGSAQIFFSPYKKDDVFSILKDRAKKAFVKKIDEQVLQYCAQVSAIDNGDARRALDLLRVAAENCNGTITEKDIENAQEQLQAGKLYDVIKTAAQSFRRIFLCIARISYITGKKWHSTAVVYGQYERFFLDETVGHLSYRRVFGILAELEQAGILASKKEAGDRGGYNKQHMLTIPAETAKILDEKQLQIWKSIKESRFNHLYNPRGKGNSYEEKEAKYENQKMWKKILGEYDDPE